MSLRISANLVDPLARRIRPATITVEGGRIADVHFDEAEHPTWILPGFVDSHLHVESSLLPPSELARMAIVHGTVAAVSDPHEIANVLGVPGIEYMLSDARGIPFKLHFGAPSCVPATPFDHAGATIGPEDVAALLDHPDIGYLAEMMNYPGVVAGDPGPHAKIAAARARKKPVDGHAPRLRGADLRAYVESGISTDHEIIELDEAMEKIAAGMFVIVREGSAAKNFDALCPLIDSRPDRCMFCSDDKHPDDLLLGHINLLVRRALARGSDLFDVLRVASVNPVKHYGLPVGLLQPGDPADFLEVDDLSTLRIRRVYVDGVLAAEDGVARWPHRPPAAPNRFSAHAKRPEDFRVPVTAAQAGKRVRVIEAIDGQLVTGCALLAPRVESDLLMASPAEDVLKLALVDRYEDRPPAVAMVKGFGLARGAIASSVSHDSHHLVAVGATDAELARAVDLVVAARGGLSAVGLEHEEILPLPIAGLMSDRPGAEVAARYSTLDRYAKQLGSRLSAPFMTLSFMALLVIPALKLSPNGLFDVERFRRVGLFEEAT